MSKKAALSEETALSKEAAARVRDELLQSLYANVLRCTLQSAHAGVNTQSEGGAAVAAGVCANLRPEDILFLPTHGATGFRTLRGAGAQSASSVPQRDFAAGVLSLPKEEPSAVAFALGAAAAAARGVVGALVCVLLPRGQAMPAPAPIAPGNTGSSSKFHPGQAPATWSEAGVYAARIALPLLLIADKPPQPRGKGAPLSSAHRLPAPLYPSIPVDREDALAIYRVVYECAARARTQGGPSHLACVPFRVKGQDAPQDALARLEAMLQKRGAFGKTWRRQLERKLIHELST